MGEERSMKKLLVEGKRIVGMAEAPPGVGGTVEYGRRDPQGILHVTGRARLVSLAEMRGPLQRLRMAEQEPILYDL